MGKDYHPIKTLSVLGCRMIAVLQTWCPEEG